MNKLPDEILHIIFIRLPFKRRLECMLVCRNWYNVLSNRSLLYTKRILGITMYNKFIDMLQHRLNRGTQVEFLDLDIESTKEFDYEQFCNMLPNLREIRFVSTECWITDPDRCSRPLELEHLNSKLEAVLDYGNCGLTRQLLVSNVCTSLRKLAIEIGLVDNLGSEVFVYLKNAPTLEDLTLYGGYLGIEDCEILHKNTLTLTAFRLKDVMIAAGELPREIISASSVKTLSMAVLEIKDYATYPNWYEYIAKKYTSLKDFDYKDENMANVDPTQAMKIYRDGILPIYKNMESQGNIFKAVNIPIELDIFNKLSEFGLSFETFHLNNNGTRSIFTQLAESKLSKYAKYITLISTTIPSPMMLQNFTFLKSLRINMYENSRHAWDANLTDYLNAIPLTVTSFKATFSNAEINELPTHSNNIEELHINCDTIYPKMGEAISTCFPQLTKLHLQGLVSEDLSIDLSHSHFKKLEFAAYFDGNLPHGFLVTNAKHPQPKYYCGKERADGSGLYEVKPATAEEIQDRVHINLKYATKYRSVLNDFPIFFRTFSR